MDQRWDQYIKGMGFNMTNTQKLEAIAQAAIDKAIELGLPVVTEKDKVSVLGAAYYLYDTILESEQRIARLFDCDNK